MKTVYYSLRGIRPPDPSEEGTQETDLGLFDSYDGAEKIRSVFTGAANGEVELRTTGVLTKVKVERFHTFIIVPMINYSGPMPEDMVEYFARRKGE